MNPTSPAICVCQRGWRRLAISAINCRRRSSRRQSSRYKSTGMIAIGRTCCGTNIHCKAVDCSVNLVLRSGVINRFQLRRARWAENVCLSGCRAAID
jgi:hypothetical protein